MCACVRAHACVRPWVWEGVGGCGCEYVGVYVRARVCMCVDGAGGRGGWVSTQSDRFAWPHI